MFPSIALAALLALVPAAHAQAPATLDFAQAVEQVEKARGLEFLRPPRLVSHAVGAPFQAALAGIPNRLAIECPAPDFAMRSVASAAADTATDRIVAAADASAADVRVALAHLLDAQHHPGLVQAAVQRRGDAGIAQRGLLAASACTTAQGGFGPAQTEEDAGPFADPVIEVSEPSEGGRLLQSATAVATTFLRRLPDREAAFQRPPQSTLELMEPGRWEAGEPPLELVGAAPDEPGCQVTRDESLGVLALSRELARVGGRVPRGAFVGWRGDRLITWACEDGRSPSLYAAEFERDADAADFRIAAGAILPHDLQRPFTALATGRRVIAWHALEESAARQFGTSLETRSLR